MPDVVEDIVTEQRKARRGFAAMDAEMQRAISRRGGAGVPAGKRSFSTNRALAVAAGRKGGKAPGKGKGR